MGSYLSEPVTEKISGDEQGDKMNCGHSSMQGWRVTQEDAHNCLLNFDVNTALFAVYDGHGGHEVAQYTAQKLPDFIKETEAYKKGDYEKALIDAFLQFDATIATPEVVALLKAIAGDKEAAEESDEEENVDHLYEEAAMPIEMVMKKYAQNLLNPAVANLTAEGKRLPSSPYLKPRRDNPDGPSSSGSSTASSSKCSIEDNVCSSSSEVNGDSQAGQSSESSDGIQTTEESSISDSTNGTEELVSQSGVDGNSEKMEVESAVKIEGKSKEEGNDVKQDEGNFVNDEKVSSVKEETGSSVNEGNGGPAEEGEGSSSKQGKGSSSKEGKGTSSKEEKGSLVEEEKGNLMKEETSSSAKNEHPEGKDGDAPDSSGDCLTKHHNGEVSTEDKSSNDVTSTCTPMENGDPPKITKGKARMKTKGVKTPPQVKVRPKRTASQIYNKLLKMSGESDEEDSEDEEDKTFEGPQDLDDSDSETEDKTVEGEDSEEDGNTSLEFGEEEEEDEEDDEEDEEDEEDSEFARNMREEPGSDSGCTAVVALLKGNELYVANAGDSRCVVCRNGKAVEMSFDHKPEDEPERERVYKAGGRVTADGRVNGGLNLSRAIGDHAYKQNGELSDREQMITALPDVRKLVLNPGEDEFMVLACDGIWNFMSSQEVVDFVKPRIDEDNVKLSQICEEMFDHCLAPNTLGDGTGCDNMTAIIVKFKSNIMKRPAEEEGEQSDGSKRAKTEESRSEPESTAA